MYVFGRITEKVCFGKIRPIHPKNGNANSKEYDKNKYTMICDKQYMTYDIRKEKNTRNITA